ncbi:MAG TPA: ABC transporter substrate-binding protein [Methylomirabilota bacterium]|nr:ABC transporter substrate-binding protein [Methylomirabilota bacterium]
MFEGRFVSAAARLTFLALLVVLTTSFGADAQQGGKVARIGFLSGDAPPAAPDWKQHSVTYQALSDLGWREGSNLLTEWRWADGRLERLPDLAGELVRLNVDVIVAGAFKPGQVARQATRRIPIVLVTCDPYRWIVDSLARPGGNVTGQTCMSSELSPKKLEFLKQAVPRISRVAFLYNPDDPGPSQALKFCQDAAPSLGVTLFPVTIQHPSEIDHALSTIAKERPDALFVYPDSVTARVRDQTIDFVNRQRLPAVYGFRAWVDAGGLLSYGASLADMQRRAMGQVDKILKGARPADLPVEQPSKFDLIINLKAAKALGLTIPHSLLLRADEIIQ